MFATGIPVKKEDKKTKAFYDWATTGIPVMKALVASERYQEELNVRFIVAENNRAVKLECYQVTLR